MTVWCLDPFVHIDIIVENNLVRYKPCNTYTEDFHTPDFTEVKKSLSQNTWASGCDFCKNAESHGTTSRRQGVNVIHADKKILPTPQSIGVRYGTLCNSTCLICDESRSSAWASKLIKENISVRPEYRFNKSLMPSATDIIGSLNVSRVTNVEFHGGEPLINAYPWDIVQLLGPQNLTVKINTNGTVWPEKMTEFTRCKRVEILFSIDDINDRLEFLRPPAKFDQVENNITTSKNMGFVTGCTYVASSLNVYYLPEFLSWALPKFSGRVYGQHMFGPDKYNLHNLSDYAKLQVQDKFSQYPYLKKHLDPIIIAMNTPRTQVDQQLDQIRLSRGFTMAMPEWAEILDHD
jgi:sulfatase maturation enzyme AslB (radical SAM superfamily)